MSYFRSPIYFQCSFFYVNLLINCPFKKFIFIRTFENVSLIYFNLVLLAYIKIINSVLHHGFTISYECGYFISNNYLIFSEMNKILEYILIYFSILHFL
jgi:hypothetical protein